MDIFGRGLHAINVNKKNSRSLVSQVQSPFGKFTNDGRLGYTYGIDTFCVTDFFHGITQSIEIAKIEDAGQIQMVDDEHFLIKFGSHLSYFKFDLSTFVLVQLDSVEFDKRVELGDLRLDQKDKTRFIIYSTPSRDFLTGRIFEDQILLDNVSTLDTDGLKYWKLDGGQLCGFTSMIFRWNYCEVNVQTKASRRLEIPAMNDNDRSNLGKDYPFIWSGNYLYVASFQYMQNYCKIIEFDSDIRRWTNTRIETGRYVSSMFMDNDGFLMIINNMSNVYRFPLRKPDTLTNLAWFEYSRRYKMLGMDAYKKLLDLLPANCDLCLKLPEIEQVDPNKPGSSKESGDLDKKDDEGRVAVLTKRHCDNRRYMTDFDKM